MRKFIIILLFQIGLPILLHAQISGILREAGTDKILEGAQVFINNSSISGITNDKGEFILEGIAPGFVNFVVYKKGYSIFRSPIRIQQGKASRLNLKLNPLAEPEPTVPTREKEWFKSLQKFEPLFLGISPYTQKCKIINPQVINFSAGHPLSISLIEPLVIENQALGYRITYYLDHATIEANQALSSGALRFDTLVSSNVRQAQEWNGNRMNQFFGSRQHFFWSLVGGMTGEQGFELLNDRDEPLIADSLLRPSKMAGYRKIHLTSPLQVRFLDTGNGLPEQVSWIASKEDFEVNSNGVPFLEQAIEVTGAMKTLLADREPLDYFPASRMDDLDAAREIINQLQERIYIHSDKPYYYPGEPLWLKGYVNYLHPEYRDSLSRTMIVEFLSQERSIILSRTLRIDGGSAHGDFILPDTLRAGNYYLRAYTSLMRNFGRTNYFVQTIPVIDILDKVVADQSRAIQSPGQMLSIGSDKPKYKPRERIRLEIKVRDSAGRALASDLSVSVTDEAKVVPVSESSIEKEFPFATNPEGVAPFLRYPVESGVSFSGRFFNEVGKPEKATLTIVQGKYENVITRDTDEQGMFWETGFDFYDSLEFLIEAKNSNGKHYGKVVLLDRETPSVDFMERAMNLKASRTGTRQRVITEYEVPKGSRLLKEVTVSAKKVQMTAFHQQHGQPSRVYKGEALTGIDMVTALRQRIFGLSVVYDEYGQQKISIPGIAGKVVDGEPMIYVDNELKGGGSMGARPAFQVLQNIDPSTVDRVEVFLRPDPSATVREANGIIHIFLKPGAGYKSPFAPFSIRGFYKPRDFSAPDYDDASTRPNIVDSRSTIYWNPGVKTDNDRGVASVSFFAADSPGKYRIVIEGVTQMGVPVRCEGVLEVVK